MPEILHDAGLSAIVSHEPWEVVAEGLEFTEGPVWKAGVGLVFSDIPANRQYCIGESGERRVFREPSGNSNGLTLDLEGRLVACEHGGRRVSVERDGTMADLATHYKGKRLNSPNDVVVRSDGFIFFTDPPYGIEEREREQPCNGVYVLASDGDLRLLIDDFDRPNGLAFSPDERTLYIADTNRSHVRAFDVSGDGALTNGRIFANMLERTREDGSTVGTRPDGMKVDREGRLYVSAMNVQVYAPDGRLLGAIDAPQWPANCAWGGDGADFYITARTAVYRTRMKTTGIAPHLR